MKIFEWIHHYSRQLANCAIRAYRVSECAEISGGNREGKNVIEELAGGVGHGRGGVSVLGPREPLPRALARWTCVLDTRPAEQNGQLVASATIYCRQVRETVSHTRWPPITRKLIDSIGRLILTGTQRKRQTDRPRNKLSALRSPASSMQPLSFISRTIIIRLFFFSVNVCVFFFFFWRLSGTPIYFTFFYPTICF